MQGGGHSKIPLRRDGPRWMELKDKDLPARSSRPSQGEGEVHRMPASVALAPTTLSRLLGAAGRIPPTELPDRDVFL